MNHFSKAVEWLVAVSVIPFVILNFLGGIIGGVWLLFLGEWQFVVFWVLAMIFIPFLQSILLLPTIPLGMLLAYLLEKQRAGIASIVAFLNMLYVQAVGLLWTVFVFLTMLSIGQDSHLVAYLLFGYAMATGPYSYMASKEGPDALGSHVAVWLVQLAFVLLSVFYYLGILFLALPLIVVVTIGVEVWLVNVAMALHRIEKQQTTLGL